MKLKLKIWRQAGPEGSGQFEMHDLDGVSEDCSFLEMLDLLNEQLLGNGKEPISFDHDCREGICGTCSLTINGLPHGPEDSTTTCQLHMRKFRDGETITIEPFRAKAFPVVRDLVVDRSPFDKIIQAGGYVSVRTGSAPDGNAIPIAKQDADLAMDAAACIGCGACVAACYTENAIPIVGEEGMARHREMSWIRIERYVDEGDRTGGLERRPHPDREALGKTDVRYAPMLCQHCGAAPCESVCPVIATYHTPEGLNGMVYNRCVGTRYCGNNCSYKVRRFNYFDYSRHNWPGNLNLMQNPDVTTRQQGVMEKCSFCVQRIVTARQTAKNEDRPIADGEVVTACQQTCPSQAIEFGNAKDKKSKVVVTSNNEKRAYHSLHVLNTRPAITYLKQVDRADDERSHG